MPLLYIPLNISKCCKKYNIPDNKYVNKQIYENFLEIIENNFCPFELITGKNIGNICGAKIKKDEKYCKRHIKYLNNINTKDELIRKKKFYCSSKSYRRINCGRLVKGSNEICSFHKNKINNNNYILNLDTFYFKEYKNYLYSMDNYNDIIYEMYSSEYSTYKKYLNNIYYDYDDIVYKKYKFDNEIIDIVKHSFNTDILYKIVDMTRKDNKKLINCKKNDCILPEINNEKLNIFKNNENLLSKKKKKKNKKKKKINDNKYIKTIKIKENIKKNIIDNMIFNICSNHNDDNDDQVDDILPIINYMNDKHNTILTKKICQIILSNINCLLKLNNNIVNIERIWNGKIEYTGYKNVIIFDKSTKLINIFSNIILLIEKIDQGTVLWFNHKDNLIDYKKKYNIDMDKEGINIYKIDDNEKKNKLNIDSLLILYF